MKQRVTPTHLIENYLIGFVIFLIPFHGFLTVWLSTVTGGYTWLRLWPSYITLFLLVLIGVPMIKNWSKRGIHKDSLLIKLAIVYVVLILLLGVIAYFFWHTVNLKALAYGLLINTRYLLWFIFAFILAQRSKWMEKHWKTLVFLPLAIVTCFALLQFFVLPADFLKHFGYDALKTIPPAQLVGANESMVRTQSFLRGPNQLGMYLMIGISMASAVILKTKKISKQAFFWYSVLAVAMAVGLFTTFSRSAWLGMITVIIVAVVVDVARRISKKMLITSIIIAACLGLGGLFVLKDSPYVQQLILHNEVGTTTATSNDGHATGLQSGMNDLSNDPLGDGPGTAGPASAYNTKQPARISESQYLDIGQEFGWLGLLLFLFLSLFIALRLYAVSESPLAYGLFLSAIGMAVANIFMYGWFDDTIAYLWWGLAGFAAAKVVPRDPVASIRRTFINMNRWLSTKFDEVFLPKRWRVDGMKDYVSQVVPEYVPTKGVVYDIGGGKRPFLSSEMAKPAGVRVVGVDIDAAELAQAPKGAYDAEIVSDVGSPNGIPRKIAKADLIICEAVLEHVQNTEQAFINTAAITKRDGKLVFFVPARNALFAQINRVLPEHIKRALLFNLFPESAHAQGFPAYYDNCTPGAFAGFCQENGLSIVEIRPYYQSTYFTFLFPAHVLWRLYQLFAFILLRENACESFTIVAVKK